jgi:hypothetical protein
LIRLFTTHYPEKNPARLREIEECLEINLSLSAFGEVCVLAEQHTLRGRRHPKLHVRDISQRPLYSDYFNWICEVAKDDDISVIANADIFFGHDIDIFNSWRIPERTVVALSRWDRLPDGSARLYDHNDSQDSWIFRGRPVGVNGDYRIGVPRCDNRIAKELELAGYSVWNPAFSIRAFHLHAGSRASYADANQPEFVPGPYGYVWPHNLWPVYRTVWHNITGPPPRIHWRFDSRLWKRKLKLHRIARISRAALSPFRRPGPGGTK